MRVGSGCLADAIRVYLGARIDSNHVVRGLLTDPGVALIAQNFNMMDRWLTAIENDKSSAAIEAKVVSNKPADVSCISPG
jgi:hypothetical protein